VVMILVAMASSLIYVSVGKSKADREGKDFSREMVSLCKKARRMAVSQGEPKAVRISSIQRRCWIDDSKKSLRIPEQMLIEGEGVTRLREDIYAIFFYPDGSSSGGELTFSMSGHVIYAFRIDLLAGLIIPIEELRD